jgi:hypothetical protein
LAGGAAAPLFGQGSPPEPPREGSEPEIPAFGPTIEFALNPADIKVQAFPMTAVRLLPGPFRSAEGANLGYMQRLAVGRLVHNFRTNVGLPSSAEPFGGWEKAGCELRGHFTGHLSVRLRIMFSTGDQHIKARGDSIVADLAECQQKLTGGYLSTFPVEYFDRLKAGKRSEHPSTPCTKSWSGCSTCSSSAGPHDSFVPKSFFIYNPMQSLAELGFVVVQIDGNFEPLQGIS